MKEIPFAMGILLLFFFGCPLLQKEDDPQIYMHVAEVFESTEANPNMPRSCIGYFPYSCDQSVAFNPEEYSHFLTWSTEEQHREWKPRPEEGEIVRVSGKEFAVIKDYYAGTPYINHTAYSVLFECHGNMFRYVLRENPFSTGKGVEELNEELMAEFAQLCSSEEQLGKHQLYGNTMLLLNGALEPPEPCQWEYSVACLEIYNGCSFYLNQDGRNLLVTWRVHENNPGVLGPEWEPFTISGKRAHRHIQESGGSTYSMVVLDCGSKTVFYATGGSDPSVVEKINREYLEGLARIC